MEENSSMLFEFMVSEKLLSERESIKAALFGNNIYFMVLNDYHVNVYYLHGTLIYLWTC